MQTSPTAVWHKIEAVQAGRIKEEMNSKLPLVARTLYLVQAEMTSLTLCHTALLTAKWRSRVHLSDCQLEHFFLLLLLLTVPG